MGQLLQTRHEREAGQTKRPSRFVSSHRFTAGLVKPRYQRLYGRRIRHPAHLSHWRVLRACANRRVAYVSKSARKAV
jgi:hypothetical protein